MISVWLLFLCLLSLKWIVINYLSLCHNSKTIKFKCLTITFTVCIRLIPLNPTCWSLLLGYGEVVAREKDLDGRSGWGALSSDADAFLGLQVGGFKSSKSVPLRSLVCLSWLFFKRLVCFVLLHHVTMQQVSPPASETKWIEVPYFGRPASQIGS